MFFVFSKLLSFFLSPIWWIAVLMLFFILLKKFKYRKALLIASFVILIVFSNPLLFYCVSGWWEGELKNLDETEHYDGIILLGGFSNYRTEQQRIVFTGSADRLLQALDLYKKGKADRFIFTGGSASIIVREKKEGEYLGEYIQAMGIPQDSLLIEWNSRNTHENAVETQGLLKEAGIEKGKFLLVTSGFHMKRAEGCFKKVGVNVVPYVTDPLQSNVRPEIWNWFTPSASTLATWERLFREWVGYAVYRLKGFYIVNG